jgi:hypothetical protein
MVTRSQGFSCRSWSWKDGRQLKQAFRFAIQGIEVVERKITMKKTVTACKKNICSDNTLKREIPVQCRNGSRGLLMQSQVLLLQETMSSQVVVSFSLRGKASQQC